MIPQYVFGKKSNHFDLGLGLRAFFVQNANVLVPTIFAGYRYQKPGGKFKFRIGYSPMKVSFSGLGDWFDTSVINKILYLYGGPRISVGYNF